MILLVSASSRAKECAAAIEQKTQQTTQVATSLANAVERLQAQEFDVVVIDESFQQLEAAAESLIGSHSETAMQIYVNLSLHGAERVTTDVTRGLQRLVGERLASMRAAENLLRNDLRGQVTAILLNSELALREGQLSTGAAAKVREVHELAEQMRGRLDGNAIPAQVAKKVSPTKSAATAGQIV
jgi:hypothetical protein